MPFKNYDQMIGERLKYLRKLSEFSQQDLAALLNVSVDKIKNYENGIDRIPADKLFDMSAILNAPISKFFDQLESSKTSKLLSDLNTKDNDIELYERTLKLIKLFIDIKDIESQDLVISLVQKLAK
ncbi:MAG: helix-turn-helix transcriptional regulator [Rhizobiales bacterium]|nr:helix-turn-helix transcriptional regulator [Hyphomicrobiales bacterium]